MKDYKRILQGVVNIIKITKKSDIGFANICAYIDEKCPELKESEGEMIRKEIISAIKEDWPGHTDWIAWLEKQGNKDEEILDLKDQIESLHAAIKALKEAHKIELEKQGEQKFNNTDFFDLRTWKYIADYVVTKWCGIGQYLDNPRLTTIAEELQKKYYLEQKQGEQKPVELIKEYDFHGVKFVPKFKKGDLIKEKLSGRILAIKDFSYYNGLYTYDTGQFPITIQNHYELVEQNPAWSEEDERIYQSIIDDTVQENQLNDEQTNWLKDIKYRYFPQPKQEWSEEYKKKLTKIYSILGQAADTHAFSTTCRLIGDKECIELQDFLKSLRPQNTWKPSDEQMKALYDSIPEMVMVISEREMILNSLYKDLRKLME